MEKERVAIANWRLAILGVLAGGLLVACSPEDISTGSPPASPVTKPNSPPVISGSPVLSATVGVPYSYAPSASDPDGDAVSWSITGKPEWATFSTASGTLSGTPSAAGTFSGITITANDGKASVSVGPFTISVSTVPAATRGTASLSWAPPAQFTDGSSLNPTTDLAGYRIYRGISPGALEPIAEVDARTTAFTVEGLAQGTHYFAVTAITLTNSESEYSAIGSKTIS